MNTLLKQAERDVRRLKKIDSHYGMTEISIFVDFSRTSTMIDCLTGLKLANEAENEDDKKYYLQSLHPDSLITDSHEPVLLCRVRVTNFQEAALLQQNH